MKPKISIIMATYNRAHFIVETLHTIQQQTFDDWECLIIDDGGTDNTQEVIANILEQDNRFQFVKRPNDYLKGLSGSRNYGLDLAQGDYIIFFDDDDIVHPQSLELSLQALLEKKSSFVHFQKQSFIDSYPSFSSQNIDYSTSISSQNIYQVVNGTIGLASCTVLWNKKCFDNCRFHEELKYAEEWECYSRIILEGFEGISLKNVLYFNRKHSNSNTGEFYSNNPIQKKSDNDAMLLVIANMENKHLLTNSILRYFIQKAINYKEYNLFSTIFKIVKLSKLQKIKWQLFYVFLPLRLYLYGIKKNFFK